MEKCDVCPKSFTYRSNMLHIFVKFIIKTLNILVNSVHEYSLESPILPVTSKACKGRQPSSSTERVLKRKQSSSKTPNKKTKLDKAKFTMLSMQSIPKVYIEETTGRTHNSNTVIGI